MLADDAVRRDGVGAGPPVDAGERGVGVQDVDGGGAHDVHCVVVVGELVAVVCAADLKLADGDAHEQQGVQHDRRPEDGREHVLVVVNHHARTTVAAPTDTTAGGRAARRATARWWCPRWRWPSSCNRTLWAFGEVGSWRAAKVVPMKMVSSRGEWAQLVPGHRYG